jgi:hypothetical protein
MKGSGSSPAGKHCMNFSIRMDSHFLHLSHRKQTISIQRISERGLQKKYSLEFGQPVRNQEL